MEMGTCFVGVGAVCALLLFLRIIRPLFPSRVNCWFCDGNWTVNYKLRHSWTCPGCKQYNGFNDDGDYNVDMGQSKERRSFCANQRKPVGGGKTEKESLEGNNGLCNTCNLNQDLKVHQLKQFVPINPKTYDEEIKEYATHLERTYRLCRYCEATLHQTLGEQDSWLKPKLLSWKLEKSRQCPLTSSINGGRSNAYTEQDLTSAFANVLIFVLSFTCWLRCLAALEVRHDIWVAVDAYLPPAVTCRLEDSIFVVFRFCKALRTDVVVVSSLLCHVFWLSYRNLIKGTFVKLALLLWTVFAVVCFVDQWIVGVGELPIFIVSSASFLTVFNFPTIRKPRIKIPSKRREEPHHTEHEDFDDVRSQDLVSTSTPMGSFLNASICSTSFESTTLKNGDDEEEEETTEKPKAHLDLSSLNIEGMGEKRNRCWDASSNSVFSLKQYDCKNVSGINFGGRRPIVRPPRFVAKSWVAGGYWLSQPVNNAAYGQSSFRYDGLPLSRSSSQSSGFVSVEKQIWPELEAAAAAGFDNELFSVPSSQKASSVGATVKSFCEAERPLPRPSSLLSSTRSTVGSRFRAAEDSGDEDDDEKCQPNVSSSSRCEKATSFLDKDINVSVRSVLLGLSIAANIALSVYLGAKLCL